MVTSPRKIPIAILIFKMQGQIIYKAFSPSAFTYESVDERDAKTDEFVTRIYNNIEYDSRHNNNTRFGKLLEIHKRYIDIPIVWRGDTVYFSTEDNIHCDYKVIHRDSPIYFEAEEAHIYQQGVGGAQITHKVATHMCV